MRVAITGSSGLVGTALRGSLLADGHDVLRIVRRAPQADDEIGWDPARGRVDARSLEGLDAVVNLAGAPWWGRRWTAAYKRNLLASRTNAARTISESLVKLDEPPRVLVSASAIAYYGHGHGIDPVDEDFTAGTGFLARVCEQWEAAATPATAADVTVCHARLGVVMTRKGGAFATMLPLFRAGLGGPLGGGEQYWSHVSLVDAVRAIRFLMETPGCTGPYNVTAPEPVTNAEFARVTAYLMHRPTLLPLPATVLRVRYGEFAEEIMASLRVLPRRLLDAGFVYDHPNARTVVAAALR